jgi:hypothetical protein
MSPNARLFFIAGMLIIFLLFVALALTGYLSKWERFAPFEVKQSQIK